MCKCNVQILGNNLLTKRHIPRLQRPVVAWTPRTIHTTRLIVRMMPLPTKLESSTLMTVTSPGRSSGSFLQRHSGRVVDPPRATWLQRGPVVTWAIVGLCCLVAATNGALGDRNARAAEPFRLMAEAESSQPLSLADASQWTSTGTIAAKKLVEQNADEELEPLAIPALTLQHNQVQSVAISTSVHATQFPSASQMPTASLSTSDLSPNAICLPTPSSLRESLSSDRYWLISTRHITSTACRANLINPSLHISRLNRCGRTTPSSLEEYLATFDPSRPRVIYVHGNRRSAPLAIERGLNVARELQCNRLDSTPMDFVIWSWQSDRETFAVADARIKAERTDAQGLYLAWLLHHHVAAGQPTALIGFSFGGRIVTGSLHALAGGVLGRRQLPNEPVIAANIDVGLLAPAVQSDWLTSRGYHRMATQNMNRLVLLYNQRDAILKNYWLISRIRGVRALGYTGPTRFAARYDGTVLPVRSHDCSPTVGKAHSEEEYYKRSCYAGREMASLLQTCFQVD